MSRRWVEHDPIEIYENVQKCIAEAVEKAEAALGAKPVIKGLGITNQRETAVAWSKVTGKPLTNAVVWMDTRTKCASHHRRRCGRLAPSMQLPHPPAASVIIPSPCLPPNAIAGTFATASRRSSATRREPSTAHSC